MAENEMKLIDLEAHSSIGINLAYMCTDPTLEEDFGSLTLKKLIDSKTSLDAVYEIKFKI